MVDHALHATEAGLIAPRQNIMGFFGGFVLSAIKRDRGVKDWGAMIEGHGGMLDRVDLAQLLGADLLPHRALLVGMTPIATGRG